MNDQMQIKYLKKEGYLILKNFINKDECALLNSLSHQLMSESQDGPSDRLNIDDNQSDYDTLAQSTKTTLSKRGANGIDQNFLDFFNPQHWFQNSDSQAAPILKKFSSGLIYNILKEVDSSLRPKNMNLYCHNGVLSPRTHHIDSIRPYFKVFIALSDQTTDDCGPLALIPRTHRNKVFNYLMCLYNSRILGKKNGTVTDVTFYKASRLKPMHLSPGDALISNQSIVHGAIPALGDGRRLTLLQTYDIK